MKKTEEEKMKEVFCAFYAVLTYSRPDVESSACAVYDDAETLWIEHRKCFAPDPE